MDHISCNKAKKETQCLAKLAWTTKKRILHTTSVHGLRSIWVPTYKLQKSLILHRKKKYLWPNIYLGEKSFLTSPSKWSPEAWDLIIVVILTSVKSRLKTMQFPVVLYVRTSFTIAEEDVTFRFFLDFSRSCWALLKTAPLTWCLKYIYTLGFSNELHWSHRQSSHLSQCGLNQKHRRIILYC